jgi:hypothetical protein
MTLLLLAAALQLVDQCGSVPDPRAVAEVVVTGVIESDTLVRRPVPMRRDSRVLLQLRRVRLRVENVLLGEVAPGPVEVYYFTFWSGYVGNAPMGLWEKGSRRVWWLRRDGDVLRTTCDGVDGCTLSLASGAHPGYRMEAGQSVDSAVVELRMTRGKGPVREIAFATTIIEGPRAVVPEPVLIGFLRRLVETEKGVVREAACEMVWIEALDYAAAEDILAAGLCRCAELPERHVCRQLDSGGVARRP